MTDTKFVDTFGFRVFSDKLGLISTHNSSAMVMNTTNDNSYGTSTKETILKERLRNSGYPMHNCDYFALLMPKVKNINRNQYPNICYHFTGRLKINNAKAFVAGSGIKTLENINLKIFRAYSNIQAIYFRNVFGWFSGTLEAEYLFWYKLRLCWLPGIF